MNEAVMARLAELENSFDIRLRLVYIYICYAALHVCAVVHALAFVAHALNICATDESLN